MSLFSCSVCRPCALSLWSGVVHPGKTSVPRRLFAEGGGNYGGCVPRRALPPLATCLLLILSDSSINPSISSMVATLRAESKMLPAGYLHPLFMPSRPVVFRRRSGRLFPQVDGSGQRAEFMTKKDGVVTEEPLVVWVDGGSASSSEVRRTRSSSQALKNVAGCFQTNIACIPLKTIDPRPRC